MSFSVSGEDWVLANLAIARASGVGWSYASISNLSDVERKLRAAIRAGHVRLRGRTHYDSEPVEIATPLAGVFRLDLGLANELTLGLGEQRQTFTNLEIDWRSAEPHLRTASTGSTVANEMHPPLRPAPESEVRKALQAVYDEAEHRGDKPPNIKEVVCAAQGNLAEHGLAASGRQIQKVAATPEFEQRRLKPGHRF